MWKLHLMPNLAKSFVKKKPRTALYQLLFQLSGVFTQKLHDPFDGQTDDPESILNPL